MNLPQLYRWLQKYLFFRFYSRPEQLRKPVYYFILFIFVLLSSTLIFLREKSNPLFSWQEGKIWNAPNLYSPITFALEKDSLIYQSQLDSAIRSIPLPFQYIPQTTVEVIKRIDLIEKQLTSSPPISLNDLYWLPDTNQLHILVSFRKNKRIFTNFKNEILNIYKQYYLIEQYEPNFNQHEYVSIQKDGAWEELRPITFVKEVSEVKKQLIEKYSQFIPQEGKTIFSHLLNFLILPNISFQKDIYETKINEIFLFFPKHYQLITKGEIIIRKGEPITSQKVEVLNQLKSQLKRQTSEYNESYFLNFLGIFLLVSILLYLKIYFIKINRSRIFQHNRNIALILFAILLVEIIAYLLLRYLPTFINASEEEISWLIPVALAPIFVTIFHDDRLGFITAIFTALLISFQTVNPFSSFVIHALASSAGVFYIYHLTKRSQFFFSILLILFVYIVSYSALTLISFNYLHQFSFFSYLLFFFNIVLVISSYPLIYVFEKLFRISSDLSLLELLNQDHILLRQLAERAQGTFHHSLQVANLAEACAKEIGANALLVRVGALFHDIGKMENPQYFIENQTKGINPHDHLSPKESAQILIRHVTYGAELAQQYGLPDEIIRFILTHHGTTRAGYFYMTYLKQQQRETLTEEEEIHFRYPGPTPLTKEEGILMLADSVEAASRAMENPTPEKLDQLVDAIIEDKLSQNQFENCSLSFRDLENIRHILKKQIKALYHQRIEYPEKQTP